MIKFVAPIPLSAGKYTNHGTDFIGVFYNGRQRVGITSRGDNYKIVHGDLTYLVNKNCDVCICACRTSDRIPLGTIAAVNSFVRYPPQFIRKIYAAAYAQLTTNTTDANNIFAAI